VVAASSTQSGFYAGRRIRSLLEDDAQVKPFRYRDLGSAAYIARGRAVVSFKKFHASGRIGWLAWLGIHITFLTGYRNRLGALLSWTLTFSRESRRERAFTMQQIVGGGDLYDVDLYGAPPKAAPSPDE
jgi:NADH:ubiquinone reductase (H+-translocating)